MILYPASTGSLWLWYLEARELWLAERVPTKLWVGVWDSVLWMLGEDLHGNEEKACYKSSDFPQ